MEKVLSQIEKWLLYVVVFLTPITVLSMSPNPYVVGKLTVLSFGVGLILLVHAGKILASGKLHFAVGNFDFPVLLIMLAYIVSAIFKTPNKMEALLLPGTVTAVVSGGLLYYLVNQLKEAEKRNLSLAVIISGAVFGLLTFLAFVGIFAKIPQLPAYVRATSFTPEGGYLPATIFLATLVPISIGLFISEKEMGNKITVSIASLLILIGLGVSVFNILPGRPFAPQFPGYTTTWSVAIDSLKESPIFGIGPGNYISAFSRYRPLAYNTTNLWSIKFTTANNYYFTALTETGMLGFAGIILLLLVVYRTAKKDIKEKKLVQWGFAANANFFALVVLVLAFMFAPATALLLTLLFVLLALSSKTRKTTLPLTTQGQEGEAYAAVASRLPALLITAPIILVVLFFMFRATKVVAAENKFNKAIQALAQNNAQLTYNTIREAISLNPTVDRYHITFARVDLALANAIAQKALGDNAEQLSDADRQNITSLIQQAISEGKSAVALNPLRAGNWELLGQVYRSIMPLAQGADAFAAQTYRQAVALDPINTNTRIALGGIYYATGNFENAARIFELAAATKPDHANAHYNYAYALRESGNLDSAIQEMTVVLSLLDRTSQDYAVARKALEDMQEQRNAQAPQGTELTPPLESGEQLEPPIELPEDAQPPESPVSPTPTPQQGEENPSPTVSISPILTPTPTP